MIIDEISNFYNKPRDKKKIIGRYYASEIGSILKGYITTTNYFDQKPVDKKGQANMFRGSAMEEQLGKILKEQGVEFETQTPLELRVEDFIISGKLDFNFKDYIVETKCPQDLTNGIPDKWKCQCECYFRATNKKVYLGIFDKTGDNIIRFFPYEPSDALWEEIKTKMSDFHRRLKKRYGQV
jgi:hypothetical protein